MKIESLNKERAFGARVTQINSKTLISEDLPRILPALYQYGFLIFSDVFFDEKEYVHFGKSLGSLRVFVDENYRHPLFPEIFVVSNLKDRVYGMDRVGLYWHSDCSFLAEPQPMTMLYCQSAPENGGETAFMDTRKLYNDLSCEVKEMLSQRQYWHQGQTRYIITAQDVGLSIQEFFQRDQKIAPLVSHPAVLQHPSTQEHALYVNPGFTLENTPELSSLFEYIESSKFYYKHSWKANEIILWDNRLTMHKAFLSTNASPRVMFRLGISDGSFFIKDRSNDKHWD